MREKCDGSMRRSRCISSALWLIEHGGVEELGAAIRMLDWLLAHFSVDGVDVPVRIGYVAPSNDAVASNDVVASNDAVVSPVVSAKQQVAFPYILIMLRVRTPFVALSPHPFAPRPLTALPPTRTAGISYR